MKRVCLSLFSLILTMRVSAQNVDSLYVGNNATESMPLMEETASIRHKEEWALGGFIMLLAPEPDYYDKTLQLYNPPAPMIWFGPSQLNNSMMGDRDAQFHLRSGVFNKIDCGFTFLQISRNLYRGNVGVSASLQYGGYMFNLSRNYTFEKDGHHVEYLPADDENKKDLLSFSMLRVPLMIGAQTNNRLFSLQTGLGLILTTRLGAQWLVTAGLGPITVSYSQNLTPLFKLTDGTKAFPSSFSVGVDIWYWMCRFSHPPKH